MITGHGDDGYLYTQGDTQGIRANFSSNTWYGGPAPGLTAYLKERLSVIGHYPEPGAESLQRALAEEQGCDEQQLMVTNGATEAIYLLAQAFRGQTATILLPSFSEYGDACRLQDIHTSEMSWDELTADTRFDTALVFICNPNNPTGQALPPDTLQRLLYNSPRSCFVIDEAYMAFTTAAVSIAADRGGPDNYILLRSLTKDCCIPGLRLGYAWASADRLRPLRHYRMPWSVNALALEAGHYICRHPEQFRLPLEGLLQETALLQQQLQAATGWKIGHSSTHYFLFRTDGKMNAAALKQYLLRTQGILIRDASNFPGLDPYTCRVSCQSPAHNQLLIQALTQCSNT